MRKHGFIILSIFLGGALGTVFRYLINLQVMEMIFPLGTLIENLIGSFLLGALTGYILLKKLPFYLKEGIGVGFCGGFTTMSTLAGDAVYLGSSASYWSLAIYLMSSLFGGLLMAFLGLILSQSYVRRKVKGADVQ